MTGHGKQSEQSQQASRIKSKSPVSVLSRKLPDTSSMWRRRRSSNKSNPTSEQSFVLSNISNDSIIGSNTSDPPQQSAGKVLEFASDPNPVTQEHNMGDVSNACVIFANAEIVANQTTETAP